MKKIDTAKLLPPFEKLITVQAMKSLVLRPESKEVVKKTKGGDNLFIFIGSSGAGRDTVMEECLAHFKNGVRLKRTTTRKPRETIEEKDKQRMIFTLKKTFLNDFKKGNILFAGRYKANKKLYGISKKEILKIRDKGKFFFLEENFSGLPLKILFPDSKLIIVLPPTLDVLKDRLFSRDKNDKECEERFKISVLEIKAFLKNLEKLVDERFLDMIVVNEGLPGRVGERLSKAIIRKRRLIDDYQRVKESFK